MKPPKARAPEGRAAVEPFRGSFVGREEDLFVVERLVAGKSARLITLLGPGGVGKTRLLYRLANELRKNANIVTIIACDLASSMCSAPPSKMH
jgi:flagellar biosynthesis GTPase FlhF